VSLREIANSFHHHYSTICWIKEKIKEFREAWPACLLLIDKLKMITIMVFEGLVN
jgi:hypothetical protein